VTDANVVSGEHQTHRDAILGALSRQSDGDGETRGQLVASLRRLGLLTATGVGLAAAAAPAAQATKVGYYCNIRDTSIVLDNPNTNNNPPWTCIRWQQSYNDMQYVAAFTGRSSSTVCGGVTSSGNVDPRHLASMPDIHGRYVCAKHSAGCSAQCVGYDGHPWLKDWGGPHQSGFFQGYNSYS
jgi:hypothetical protein